MKKIVLSIIVFACLISCHQRDQKLNYVSSPAAAFNMIKVCIDAILKMQPGINTDNYVVDLSAINNLNQPGKDVFTRYKNSGMSVTHQDSLIIYDDPSRETFHMAKSMMITFDSVEQILVLRKKSKHLLSG